MKSVAAQGLDTQTLLRNLDGQIAVPAIAPDLDCMISGIGHDPDALHDFVSRRFPGTGLVGGSSSSGLMTLDGLWDSNAVGLPLIVAEGVETAQELACLRFHAGTCLAQGYLFARPTLLEARPAPSDSGPRGAGQSRPPARTGNPVPGRPGRGPLQAPASQR